MNFFEFVVFRLVFQEFDLSGPVRLLTCELHNMETCLAGAEDIEPAILESFNLDNAGSHADAMNRFFTFLLRAFAQQHETKDVGLIDASADHEFVPLFENVKRNGDLREKNEVRQRE